MDHNRALLILGLIGIGVAIGAAYWAHLDAHAIIDAILRHPAK